MVHQFGFASAQEWDHEVSFASQGSSHREVRNWNTQSAKSGPFGLTKATTVKMSRRTTLFLRKRSDFKRSGEVFDRPGRLQSQFWPGVLVLSGARWPSLQGDGRLAVGAGNSLATRLVHPSAVILVLLLTTLFHFLINRVKM
jgi:hypothetical protein